MKKYSISLLLSLYVIFLFPIPIQGIAEPTDLFYVNDSANVISEEHETYYVTHGEALNQATGAQIVVAAIDDLEGQTIFDYAVSLFRAWGIGDKDKDNGLLILVSPKERQIYVSVGYGLEGAINDAKVGRLIDDYAIPFLAENDFDTGLYQLYNAFLSEVYQEYNLEVPDTIESDIIDSNMIEPDRQESEENTPRIPKVFIIMGVIILLIFITNRKKNREQNSYPNQRFYPSQNFGNRNRYTTNYHRQTNNHNRRTGGGFKGGGFKGGGGSTGGGGAGRSF